MTIALLHPIDSPHRRALGFMNQTIYFSYSMKNIHIENTHAKGNNRQGAKSARKGKDKIDNRKGAKAQRKAAKNFRFGFPLRTLCAFASLRLLVV